MSDLELTMMRRVGELNKEVARLKAEVNRLEEIVGSDAIDKKYGMCCDASDEVARLKAEVEMLTDCKAEADRLKAEVERLRKAGDEMVQLLDHMDVVMDMNSDHPEVEAWNAAKEGKQS
jgi:uncharacterized small protein (DUF1192 family)